MNDFFTTGAGFSPGGESPVCANGQGWSVENDLWIAFVPALPNLTITVDVLGNCSSGNGVQALIHDNCSQPPIDCDVDCGGSPDVGGVITFVPGQTYYLRIDGCSGAICPVQITVTPSNGIIPPPDNIQPKWPATGLIQGKNQVPCPGKESTHSVPLNICATAYNWTIESGDAEIINTQGDEFVDNNPGQPGTSVTIVGSMRNAVQVLFKSAGKVKLCVEGTNGCHTTGKTCITIIVDPPTMAGKMLTSLIINKTSLCKNDYGTTFEVNVPKELGPDLHFDWRIAVDSMNSNPGAWIVSTVGNKTLVKFFKTGIYVIKCTINDYCSGTIVNAMDTFSIVSPCAFAAKGCSDGSNPKGLRNHTLNIYDSSRNKSFSRKMLLDSLLNVGVCDISDIGLAPGKGEAVMSIACSRDDWRDGVRTSDLVAISRHILMAEAFSSPYQYLAADVNYNGKVSTSDIIELKKLILVNIDTLSLVNNWRFVPQYFFDTTVCNFSSFDTDPLLAKCLFKASGKSLGYLKNGQGKSYMDEFSVPLDSNYLQKQNTWSLKAVKSGDVNCSVDDTALHEDSGHENKLLRTPHRCFEAGEVVNFIVQAKANTNVTAWEMGVKVNPEFLQLVDVEKSCAGNEVDLENFGLRRWNEGEFRALWIDPLLKQVDMRRNTELFALKLKVKQATCNFESLFLLDNHILPTKFYDGKVEIPDVQLVLGVEDFKGEHEAQLLKKDDERPIREVER